MKLPLLMLMTIMIWIGACTPVLSNKSEAPTSGVLYDTPTRYLSPTLFFTPTRTPTSTPAPTSTLVPTHKPSPTPVISLRLLADQRGLAIGAATDPSFWNRPGYTDLLVREFNMLAVENVMKWESIHPERNRYDFSRSDQIVAFAKENDMLVYGHVLVWDMQNPAWVTEGHFSKKEWKQILRDHIQTVVGRYRGKVWAWDVVNEAIGTDGALWNTHWLRVIGPEYIALAFHWAHEADPDAILVYNDHEGEGLNEKSQAIYNLVKNLKDSGVPIDAVGFQMHVWLDGPPAHDELAANMKRLAELGLDVHITEMDVRTQYSHESLENKLDAQAEIYRQAMISCLAITNCKAFLTWGLTDRESWIPGYTGNPDIPLLFDLNSQPKPAYWALHSALKGR